jgi:hypothetical protein
MMRHCALLATVCFAAALVGCSREETLSCESTERYSTAQSVQPVRIPDDLSPPDESGALRLPPDVADDRRAPTQPCLESPPSFFDDQRPGRSGRPAAAEPPPDEVPAPDPERSIDN